MPDISMCSDDACPSASKCYRHEAEPNPYRQSYMDWNRTPGADRCYGFYPVAEAPTRLREQEQNEGEKVVATGGKLSKTGGKPTTDDLA